MPTLGMLICTCDADQKHFDRVLGEFTRLRIPFAVNFDHCCKETKRHFQSSPLYLGGKENDAVGKLDDDFDESHRQGGLDVLMREPGRFDWAGYLDTDESFAPKVNEVEIQRMLAKCSDIDLIDTPLIDLWGDEKHWRDDGPFKNSHRERFYNLRSGKWKYTSAVVHAPKLLKDQETVARRQHLQDPLGTRVILYPMYFLHWGIMNQEDCQFHIKRWNEVYTKKVGNNPYGFYEYIGKPDLYPPNIRRVDEVLK